MLRIQTKIYCHTKAQKNHNLDEKRQSVDAKTNMNKILEVSDVNFKAAAVKIISNQLQIENKKNEN